jgi:hypothetical protein
MPKSPPLNVGVDGEKAADNTLNECSGDSEPEYSEYEQGGVGDEVGAYGAFFSEPCSRSENEAKPLS